MEDSHTFIIIVDDLSLKNYSSHVHVLLKNERGKIIKTVIENALLHDKDFRDISGLYIGLKEAAKAKAERILIVTDNPFLGAIMKEGIKGDCEGDYGFYPDIEKLVAGFEEVKIELVSWKNRAANVADYHLTDLLSLGIQVPAQVSI
ncbi:MAG: hypothetical protein ACMUIA_06150 [bacterium]